MSGFFSALSLGHRREQVRDEITDDVISGSPAHGGIGHRCRMAGGSFDQQRARAMMTFGGTAWFPLRPSRHIMINGDRVEQQAANAAFMVNLNLAFRY